MRHTARRNGNLGLYLLKLEHAVIVNTLNGIGELNLFGNDAFNFRDYKILCIKIIRYKSEYIFK